MITIEKLAEVIKRIEELASKGLQNDDLSCYDATPYVLRRSIDNGKILLARELLEILTKD